MPTPKPQAAILKALKAGPKLPAELRAAVGLERQKLANEIKTLLRNGKISRQAISVGRWKYYYGKTAPEWHGYLPETRKTPSGTTKHAMPVKRIEIPADCGRTNRISLPLAPWEVRA